MLKELTPVLTILICVYGLVDIIIPSFSKLEYFWFVKQWATGKKKSADLASELADAEKAFNEAFESLKNITDKGTAEYETAKASYNKAEALYKKAKEVFEKVKTETNK